MRKEKYKLFMMMNTGKHKQTTKGNNLLVERSQLGLQLWKSGMTTFPKDHNQNNSLNLFPEVTKVSRIATSSLGWDHPSSTLPPRNTMNKTQNPM